jgi:hypothetical protein
MSEERQSQQSLDRVSRKTAYETPALTRLGSMADVTLGGTMPGLDTTFIGSAGVE